MASPFDFDRVVAQAPSGEADYDHDGRAIHWLLYYVLLVTRRRKPLFEDEAAKARCEELLAASARGIGCEVVRSEVNPSTVIVHVKAPPTVAPHNLVSRLRRETAGPLLEEFEAIRRVGAVFVHQYMVTTVPVPETTCRDFAAEVPRS